MRISSRGEYGVRAMFELTVRYGQGPTPLKVIAERQGISEHYLEQLMGALRKAGLVQSVRGAQGGYELALPPDRVRIGDIIRALEGPIALVDGGAQAAPTTGPEAITRLLWARLQKSVEAVLDATTLEAFKQEVIAAGLLGGRPMYHI